MVGLGIYGVDMGHTYHKVEIPHHFTEDPGVDAFEGHQLSVFQVLKLDYLTTIDSLCEVLRIGLFTSKQCGGYIAQVYKASSRLPVNIMTESISITKTALGI